MRSWEKPICVLHIEDDSDARLQIHQILEERGFHVVSERALASGITAATRHDVDVAILDLNLRDSTGLDTLVTFKRCFPHLPVVVLTGKHPDVGLDAIHYGADDFVTKADLDVEHFPDIIRFTCERNRRQEAAQKEVTRETRHNLATPLTPIKLQLDLIRRRLMEHPDTLGYLESIERNVHRLEGELHRFDEKTEDTWKTASDGSSTVKGLRGRDS